MWENVYLKEKARAILRIRAVLLVSHNKGN